MTTDLNASGATQQRRDEWKRLAEAATEGPWEADTYACGGTDCGCPVEGWGRVLRGNREHIVCGSPCQGEDVRFIAAARTAVPALIAEVEALTAERDDLAVWARADVNHLVQPVIGLMRLAAHKGEPVTADDLTRWADRLSEVLALADTFGDIEARNAMAGRYGLGYATTAEKQRQTDARLRALSGKVG